MKSKRAFAVVAVVAVCVAASLLVEAAPAAASFAVGAAVTDYTPPPSGTLASDPANCLPADPGQFTGPRAFSFMEPYNDQDSSGHYDLGEPFLDCNANGRWDGNILGGGSDSPRFYTHVADPVGARAFVVANGTKTIAVEVLDHEGLFNVYIQRIRDKVAADGYSLDGIFISSTHDESAPDSLGLYGVSPTTSSVNDYWNDYLVDKSAQAIEQAYDAMRPATIRYAVAQEPANMRQCWSSYPFVDNMRIPVLQALDASGQAIVTLGNVSQHAETLGFNPDPNEKTWISADWPNFFRQSLEQRFGGVAIQMAGAVGSVESPQVFSDPISGTPQQFFSAGHPAGCRTIFNPSGTTTPLGYDGETRAFGEQLSAAVEQALGSSQQSQSTEIWGERRDACIPLTNGLFAAGAAAGIFAKRPGYGGNCTVEFPPAPNGSTGGDEVKTQVASFQIGDGQFISLPGEVFPFTYWRSFLGPGDMPFPQYDLPAWPLPHMHAPYRFLDGLGEDMIGYIFPRGNGIGVPGEDPSNPTGSGDDRFGCGHSDDSEAASSQAADLLAAPLVDLLDSRGAPPETVVQGRYVLPDGSYSRDPLGRPVVKCAVDQTYDPAGPAVGVYRADLQAIVHPSTWLALDGRPQASPDRNTRGYIDSAGNRIWVDVFADLQPYDRPASAASLDVALVPNFRQTISASQCGARGGVPSTHGEPLSLPSCNPPALELGTSARFGPASQGDARLTVLPGDLSTAADEADVTVASSLTDVVSATGAGDYAPDPGGPDARLVARWRLSDGFNGSSGDAPGTTTDYSFAAGMECAPTEDPSVGSTCSVSSSADALVPESIREGKASVVQAFRIRLSDAGLDGTVGDADDQDFAQQGIFVP